MIRSPYSTNALLWFFLLAVACIAGLYFGLVPILAFIVAANFAAFGMFFIDKNSANASVGRVPEIILYIALWFGLPGGLLGMTIMHHKTRKASFLLVAILMLLLQVILAVDFLVPYLHSSANPPML